MATKSIKMDIIPLNKFDVRELSYSRKVSNGTINILYGGVPLYINSGVMECPHGINKSTDYGIITIELNPVHYEFFRQLDKTARTILSELSEELFGSKQNAENVSYYDLCQYADEDHAEAYVKLMIPYRNDLPLPAVFDRDGSRIENPNNELSRKFSALFLLSFSSITVNDGHARWNVRVMQLKIKESSKLPVGCLILDDEAEVTAIMTQREQTATFGLVHTGTGVASADGDDGDGGAEHEYDPNVNELL